MEALEKNYTIANLGCAHCAAKMEAAMNKDERIESASVNFMKNAVLVTYHPHSFKDEEELRQVLNSYIAKYEREAYILMDELCATKEPATHCDGHSCGCGEHHEHSHNDTCSTSELLKTVIPWIIGITVSLCGVFLVDNTLAKLIVVLAGYVILGYEVLLDSLNNIIHGSIFDENFLMIVATIGALYVGKYSEAIAVLLLFQIGEFLQDLAVDHSRRNLSEAMNLKALFANVETPRGIKQVQPEDVSIGDIIVVKPSEKIALDGTVIEGTSFLDTSSLTGETVPRKATIGDDVLSGCINGEQTIKIRVTKPYTESTVAKVLDLVENASSRKSSTENFITKFARVYTPIVVLLAVIIAVLPPIITGTYNFTDWVYTACSFLVVSCPCALVISVPLGFFAGIGAASKNGIIIKGSNYLEGLTTLKTVVFDKTGTLTKGSFNVELIKPLTTISEQELLEIAALLESFSTHPIATSIINTYKDKADKEPNASRLSNYKEISGHGVQADIDMATYFLGNKRYMDAIGAINVPSSVDTIGTIAYLAKGNECIGYFIISDKIKDDAKATITALKAKGIKTVLLTGDSKLVADKVAATLGLDEVYSELLPQDKVSKLEEIMNDQPGGHATAFVGDGINDAPVIARSDIGMAMGGVGSDAAIEAADIVLMTDEPGKIARAITIADYTKKIVTINIVFALGIKVLVLILLSLQLGTMWLAIFADVGVSLLAILNSIRALHVKA